MNMHAREAIGASHITYCGVALPDLTREQLIELVVGQDFVIEQMVRRAQDPRHMATPGVNSAAPVNAATSPLHFSAEPSGCGAENCEVENFGVGRC